jgi:hypothetical protein
MHPALSEGRTAVITGAASGIGPRSRQGLCDVEKSVARTRVALRSTFTLQVTASIAMSAPATMPRAPEPPASARLPSSTGI